MAADLERYVEQLLGPCRAISVTGTPERGELREVVDGEGSRWFVKRTATVRQWSAEVRAYREWVPSFADQAPWMRAADERLRVLVISAVEGGHLKRSDVDLHRRAGQLLRRIHRARPARAQHRRAAERMENRTEAVLHRLDGLLTEHEVAFLREQTRRIGELPPRQWVPCHGDYQPHNWLHDDDGVVRVIDFADSRWQQPAYDMARLYFGPWWRRPHLAEAFFDGYGRQLDEVEREFLTRQLATNAVDAIHWGHAHGIPHVERGGRARLSALMAGHRFDLREARLQAALRFLRVTRPGKP